MDKKPNIVFILTDDQGPWAMHCAGNEELHTPNLDRIAANGMRFDNFFCASPVCSPARASLMTGTIPSAHGVLDWLRGGNLDGERFAEQGAQDPYGGYVDEHQPIQYLAGKLTYTDVLTQNGYTCALSGKWHLGDSVNPQHGFKYWYTIGRGGCCYYHPDIVEDGDIRNMHGHYVTDLITDKALEFLDTLSQKENPFYLSVHYTAPHSPWGAEHHPKEFIDMYENCPFNSVPDVPDHPCMTTGPVYGTPGRKMRLRGYFAALTAMDRGVGQILDALEEKGLSDDTIVIFAADNGMNMGHHGIWGKGNGTFPFNLYDTAVKVPFIASWPGHIPEGRVAESMCSHYDIIQTLNELLGLGACLPENLPGKSFAPVLLGGEDQDNHVVILDEYGSSRMIRNRRWKYIHRYPYGPNELYDLEKDPQEKQNLADALEYAAVKAELLDTLQKWYHQYADPAVDGTREAVTGFGQMRLAGVGNEGKPGYHKG